MSSFIAAVCGRANPYPLAPVLAVMALVLAALAGGCATPLPVPEPAPWRSENGAWSGVGDVRLRSVERDKFSSEGSPGLAENARLDDYIAYGMRNSPELDSAWQRWRAAAERVSQARTLPDPQLGFGVVLDQLDASAEYMGERYSISQMFPWFGKLALRGDVALEEAQAEARRFEATRLELVERVTRAWFELAWLHRAVATAAENRELMISLESVARARYRVGEVSQADVNRAQVELGRIDDQLRSLEDMLGSAGAALNAAVGRSAIAHLPGDFGAPSRQPPGMLPELDDEQWLALARDRNPGLAAAQHLVTREQQAIELARRAYYPDITLGLEYGRDSSARMARMDGGGADMLTGTISFSLPIRRGRIAAGVREAEARLGAAASQARASEFSLEAEVQQALFVHRDSVRRVGLYGGTLVPKARQSLASTEAAYRAGEAGFSDLIDAQRVLLEFALAHERAAADRAQALARIRTLVGEPPEALPQIPSPDPGARP